MASTMWQEVSAETITVGDVVQYGSGGRVRVTRVEHHSADGEHYAVDVRVLHVAGPTDRFERYHAVRTRLVFRPLDKVTRMTPERAARVANTNLRSVLPADTRRDVEIHALEARQARHMAQIMDETRDRSDDVSDPITAYSALAAELAPLYIARKTTQGTTESTPEPKTAHTCNKGRGPAFGRKTPGCPRCDELAAGAEPRQGWTYKGRWAGPRTDAERSADLQAHFAGERHRSGGCGPVCTYGDW